MKWHRMWHLDLEKISTRPCLAISKSTQIQVHHYYITQNGLGITYSNDTTGELFILGIRIEEVANNCSWDALGVLMNGEWEAVVDILCVLSHVLSGFVSKYAGGEYGLLACIEGNLFVFLVRIGCRRIIPRWNTRNRVARASAWPRRYTRPRRYAPVLVRAPTLRHCPKTWPAPFGSIGPVMVSTVRFRDTSFVAL